MVSQCTKFEVSRFTRYEAMNGSAKCRKWASLGQLGNTQGHRQCHHSIELIRLAIRLQQKPCVYLVPFSRYIAVICRTSPILTHPTCIWRPRRGRTRSNLAEICRFEILESLCGVVCVILRLAILVELRIVADRQTDGQAHGQYCGCIASRGITYLEKSTRRIRPIRPPRKLVKNSFKC